MEDKAAVIIIIIFCTRCFFTSFYALSLCRWCFCTILSIGILHINIFDCRRTFTQSFPTKSLPFTSHTCVCVCVRMFACFIAAASFSLLSQRHCSQLDLLLLCVYMRCTRPKQVNLQNSFAA